MADDKPQPTDTAQAPHRGHARGRNTGRATPIGSIVPVSSTTPIGRVAVPWAGFRPTVPAGTTPGAGATTSSGAPTAGIPAPGIPGQGTPAPGIAGQGTPAPGTRVAGAVEPGKPEAGTPVSSGFGTPESTATAPVSPGVVPLDTTNPEAPSSATPENRAEAGVDTTEPVQSRVIPPEVDACLDVVTPTNQEAPSADDTTSLEDVTGSQEPSAVAQWLNRVPGSRQPNPPIEMPTAPTRAPEDHRRPAPDAPHGDPAEQTAGSRQPTRTGATRTAPPDDRQSRKGPELTLRPVVYVEDMAASVAFYERLGAEVVHGGPDTDWVLLQLGVAQITLVCGHRPARGADRVELTFTTVMGLAELEQHLHRGGIRIAERGTHRDFGPQLQVESPDGLLIAITPV